MGGIEYGAAPAYRVEPNELWDVGVAVQHIRDALNENYQAAARASASLGGMYDADIVLPEVAAARDQLKLAVTDPYVGLACQLEHVVAALDQHMEAMRSAIQSYERTELDAVSDVNRAGGS